MDKTERLAQISVIALAAVAVIAAMHLGEAILAPLTLALVAGVVLSPLSDFWESRGYAPVWGALVGLAATLVVVGALILAFHPIIARLVEQAPKVWSDMQEVVRGLRGLLRGLSDVTEGVADAIAPDANAAEAGTAATADDGVAMPSVADALMAAPAILSQVLIFAGSLFFFLLTRSEIYCWVSLRLSNTGGRAELAHRLRLAERNVSRYFSTITFINAGLGAITAAVLQVLGLPDAMIWGVVAFVVNFVVYLGPAVFITVLLFVGVAEFDGVLSLAPALSFLVLNAIEGQFVTPALVGRHMAVNPLLVFLALIFGLWLWGPIGGIVAIPMLLWVLVLNDAVVQPRKVATETETA
ncbi:MAG: AI-2E family transporter [Rhodobacteraceae bacterium]|nr:AI-2E family transporter [Paracoccaceae bacterium]